MADLRLGELVDPAAHQRDGTAASIPTGDLTTHGVIVGMTGSGKTGLGVVLIEEALTAGVPCLLIDPKGDLTNLCLMFPDLAPADFRPWINDGDAEKAGVTPDVFAEQQASAWRDGLAGWGIGPDRIKALRDAVGISIYTPGSTAGIPLNIVGSLQAPADVSDLEVVHDEVEGYVSGLLGLVGIEADPLSSREHILLSNLIETSWTQGRSLDLGTLVGQVQQPPIRTLGVFELDQFFPPADRTTLAIKLNGLLASPSFAAWAEGPPLDIEGLLRTPDGQPAAAIVTIAHLSDEERQFVVALVLSKLVTWMRKQSGTTDLRTLVYMDEVAGYVPPTANPPTKKPIMLLMKQARAFGVGVVLSTQNPVDIDYKAISNAGTWMVGPAPDRAGQGPAPGRDERGRWRGGRRRGRRHHQWPGQARVRAAPRREGLARGPHDPLGHELPPRPADPGPDRLADGRSPRRRTGARSRQRQRLLRRRRRPGPRPLRRPRSRSPRPRPPMTPPH